MAAAKAVGFVSGMDDSHLKPPMLRSVVRDRLPDEKRPFSNPSQLAFVLSQVRTHGLIAEYHSDLVDQKLAEAWRSAVDSWVERIVSLASSSAPDKCWAGSCLLGVTCEECCSDRFQSSYTIWFQKLLENIQSPSATHIIKGACCASLVDLFTRLACFPNLKKDGTLFARKIIQPLLQMFNEDAGETYWEVAANLLCTLISLFPSSLQQHYDNVEAILTLKIMASKSNLNTSKEFSRCLAMLPKVKGDGYTWCSVIQKILIAINSIFTDAFQGLEEEKKSYEIMRMIVPPGNDPPSPLGGQILSEERSEPATIRLSELLVPRVTTLMNSCCIMLNNPYPFLVSIPVRPLLATVERVLQVDGSYRGSSFPLTTSMHQELLCAELPALHLSSLDFLIAIIKGLRSQFLPHGANVVRLLTDYFRRARRPSIRKKLYSIAQMLLISMGVGMSLYLSQEVINNAFADLTDNLELPSSAMLFNTQSSNSVGESFQQNYRKKRKRASEISVEHPNGLDLSIKACSKKSLTPLSVKIAALKALEALLTMGGSLRSEHWRSDVDCLVITVATNACDVGWANEDKVSLMADEPSFADFQLATLEVLLASLLSPTQTRPSYLSQGLDLLRRGRQDIGSKIATFCAHALLALEVLIHPRSLPLADYPPKNLSVDDGFNQRFTGTFKNDIKTSLSSFSKDDIKLLHEEDERTKSSVMNAEVSHHVLEDENVDEIADPCLDIDETTVDKEKAEEFKPKNEISFHKSSPNKIDFGQGPSISVAEMMAPGKIDGPINIFAKMIDHGSDAPNLSVDLVKEHSAAKSLPDLRGKDAILSYDSDSFSLDSLPDIVDGDPDSE